MNTGLNQGIQDRILVYFDIDLYFRYGKTKNHIPGFRKNGVPDCMGLSGKTIEGKC